MFFIPTWDSERFWLPFAAQVPRYRQTDRSLLFIIVTCCIYVSGAQLLVFCALQSHLHSRPRTRAPPLPRLPRRHGLTQTYASSPRPIELELTLDTYRTVDQHGRLACSAVCRCVVVSLLVWFVGGLSLFLYCFVGRRPSPGGRPL